MEKSLLIVILIVVFMSRFVLVDSDNLSKTSVGWLGSAVSHPCQLCPDPQNKVTQRPLPPTSNSSSHQRALSTMTTQVPELFARCHYVCQCDYRDALDVTKDLHSMSPWLQPD